MPSVVYRISDLLDKTVEDLPIGTNHELFCSLNQRSEGCNADNNIVVGFVKTQIGLFLS